MLWNAEAHVGTQQFHPSTEALHAGQRCRVECPLPFAVITTWVEAGLGGLTLSVLTYKR
jgi:hypothetical protein